MADAFAAFNEDPDQMVHEQRDMVEKQLACLARGAVTRLFKES